MFINLIALLKSCFQIYIDLWKSLKIGLVFSVKYTIITIMKQRPPLGQTNWKLTSTCKQISFNSAMLLFSDSPSSPLKYQWTFLNLVKCIHRKIADSGICILNTFGVFDPIQLRQNSYTELTFTSLNARCLSYYLWSKTAKTTLTSLAKQACLCDAGEYRNYSIPPT